MGNPNFRNAGIPNELAQEADDAIKIFPWLGYKSFSGFATAALRNELNRIYELAKLRDKLRQQAQERGVQFSEEELTTLAKSELDED